MTHKSKAASGTVEFVAEHPFSGVEFDWLAIDTEGFIGFFSSAGVGSVPDKALRQSEILVNLVETILALPPTCEGRYTMQQDTVHREWLEVSLRGLFAFDWSAYRDRYELVAMPAVPTRIDEFLAESLVPPARDVQLPVRFSQDHAISAKGEALSA